MQRQARPMKFPRNIGFRITLGFGILVIAIFFSSVLSYRILSGIQASQKEIHTVLEPSIRQLIELQNIMHHSGHLARSWYDSGREVGSPLLQELGMILQSKLPSMQQQILRLSDDWRPRDRETFSDLNAYINDSLYGLATRFSNNLIPAIRPAGNGVSTADSLSAADPVNELLNAFDYAEYELATLVEQFDRLAAQATRKAEEVYRRTGNIMLISGLIISLTAVLIAVLLYFVLARPIKQYSDTITSMGKGIIPEGKFREGSDEMGQIGAALNSMIKGLRDLADFAEEIGKGNFKSEFSPQSAQDILGNSLIRLREDLMNAAIEEERRKRDDERRNWSNQGIARFSEIMREYSGDPLAQASQLISELVKYLGARVGGIFTIRHHDPDPGDIELIASYAYDRTKHIKKIIKPGEGLVGRCVQEGNTIFMTDIPDGYVKIKSGLGQDNPKSLLIVPLRHNERIVGVIEIASLEVFHDFQIEFVEKIGSSIASSLSG